AGERGGQPASSPISVWYTVTRHRHANLHARRAPLILLPCITVASRGEQEGRVGEKSPTDKGKCRCRYQKNRRRHRQRFLVRTILGMAASLAGEKWAGAVRLDAAREGSCGKRTEGETTEMMLFVRSLLDQSARREAERRSQLAVGVAAVLALPGRWSARD